MLTIFICISTAFGDFSGGFGGIEVNDSIVIDGIKAIHDKGGKAKVAYGGALYDMSSYIHNKYGKYITTSNKIIDILISS